VKAGDLVRGLYRRRDGSTDLQPGWLALVIEVKESNGYIHPNFMILDTAEIGSCSPVLLETISEGG